MNKKEDYWQIIRGFCIVAVILIHCPNALNTDYYGSVERFIWLIIRSVVNFPVPVFFFISGFFVKYNEKTGLKKYYISRLSRLLVPYILWSILYIIASITVNKKTYNIQDIIVTFVSGKAATPFYYIIVLVQLVILSPYLINLIRKNSRLVYIAYALPVIMLGVTYYNGIFNRIVPWYCDTLFFMWIAFYTFGIQLKYSDKSIWNKLSKGHIFGFLGLALLFNITESIILLRINVIPNLAVSQNRLGGFVYSFALILLIYKYRSIKKIIY